MLRSKSTPVLSAVAFAIALAATTPAYAVDAKIEGQAKALQKKAMEDNYLATEYAKAKEQLDKAIALCAGDKCAPAVKATLLRDLATVQFIGLNDKTGGAASMTEAAKLDPKLELNPDYETKELKQLLADAKKAGAGTGTGTTPKPPAGNGEVESDFELMAVPEQAVRTPLPLAVGYEGDQKLVKVTAHYKGFGMTSYKNLELKKLPDGKNWGANVECLDVIQGDFVYYVSGYDAGNDEVATAGTKKDPIHVAVKATIEGPAPHLPGAQPLAQCPDTGDCPPGFPGCKKSSGGGLGDPTAIGDDKSLKEEGVACESDEQCASDTCGPNDNDDGEKVCRARPAKAKFKRIWIGAAVGANLSFIPSASKVCSLTPKDQPGEGRPLVDTGYYCTSDGKNYPLRGSDGGDGSDNAAIDPNQKGNSVSGGLAAATNFPLLLTGDYAINANLLVGARLGIVLGGYDATAAKSDGKRFAAAPLHIEGRATYLLGKDALMKKGFAPMFFGGLGASTFEPSVPVSVKTNEYSLNGETKPAGTTKVTAYYMGGPFFVNAGGGGRFAVTENVALTGAVRLNAAFGNGFLFSATPEIGAQIGF